MNKTVPNGLTDRVNIPSKTTIKGSPILEGGNQLESWKSKLSKKQQIEIINIINKFGINNYSLGKMPLKK